MIIWYEQWWWPINYMTDSLLASFDKYFGVEFSQKQVFHYLDTLLLVYMESADSSESWAICILYNIFFVEVLNFSSWDLSTIQCLGLVTGFSSDCLTKKICSRIIHVRKDCRWYFGNTECMEIQCWVAVNAVDLRWKGWMFELIKKNKGWLFEVRLIHLSF